MSDGKDSASLTKPVKLIFGYTISSVLLISYMHY